MHPCDDADTELAGIGLYTYFCYFFRSCNDRLENDCERQYAVKLCRNLL